MSKEIIKCDGAPTPRGCYSQAVRAGEFLYVAGQLPLDPVTGQVVGADIGAQTERVMQSVAAIVEAAGGALADVVKTTVYVTSIENWGAVNAAYSRFFPVAPPARAVICVRELHYGALIEVDAVAWLPAKS